MVREKIMLSLIPYCSFIVILYPTTGRLCRRHLVKLPSPTLRMMMVPVTSNDELSLKDAAETLVKSGNSAQKGKVTRKQPKVRYIPEEVAWGAK